MTFKPRVFKINLQIADMDRSHYSDHLLTIAQHPSESNERLVVRLLAFVLNAHNQLKFAEGISDINQADLWIKDFNDNVELWIDIGMPDEKQIKKATIKSKQVIIYSYGGKAVDVWWSKFKADNYPNLRVYKFADHEIQILADQNFAGIKLNFIIEDGEILITTDNISVTLKPIILKLIENP